MSDSMYNSLRIPTTKGDTTTATAAIDTAIPHRQKRAAPKIISPNNHSKPTIQNKLLPAPLSVPAATTRTTTRTIQTAPPNDAVYVPTFYVHILFDGVLNYAINDDVTPLSNNNNNTSTAAGVIVGGTSDTTSIQYHDSVTTAGAGALVTIFSIPPPPLPRQSQLWMTTSKCR